MADWQTRLCGALQREGEIADQHTADSLLAQAQIREQRDRAAALLAGPIQCGIDDIATRLAAHGLRVRSRFGLSTGRELVVGREVSLDRPNARQALELDIWITYNGALHARMSLKGQRNRDLPFPATPEAIEPEAVAQAIAHAYLATL